jgi:ATP-dependent Clp protease ATP-binding subunit ClpC
MKRTFACRFINEHRENFTENALAAIAAAENLCVFLGSETVNTGHLLWGLARLGSGTASGIMNDYGIKREEIFDIIYKSGKRPKRGQDEFIPTEDGEAEERYGVNADPGSGALGYSYGAFRAIKGSYEGAVQRTQGDRRAMIGTLHLLMQLLTIDSFALHIIGDLGVDDRAFATEVTQLLNTNELMKKKMMFQMDGVELPDEDEQAATSQAFRELFMRQQDDGKGGYRENVQQADPLSYFGRDMVKEAREGRYSPVAARNDVIERMIRVLFRKTRNCPCLIGETGVGKTAVAEGLAAMIAEGAAPDIARNLRLIRIDTVSLLAGTRYRGDFEERMQMIIEEAAADKNTVLFIDDIHVLSYGSAEGGDPSAMLKSALSQTGVRIIGATSTQDYRRIFEKNNALSRLLEPIQVKEPGEEDALRMIAALSPGFESFHGVRFDPVALREAVRLSARFISDRYLPEKAIDVIDEAATLARLGKGIDRSGSGKTESGGPDEAGGKAGAPLTDGRGSSLKAQIKAKYKEKIEAIKAGDTARAAELDNEEKVLADRLEALKAAFIEKEREDVSTVDAGIIRQVISQLSGVPVAKLGEDDTRKLLELEKAIHVRLVGQDEAVSLVSKAVRRGRAGMKDPGRPIGSFLFLGPTGVGKTELARALAENLFGTEKSMIRLDMSEYMEPHSVSKMIGSPPGYVGFEDGGQLTERVRTQPYSVVLFDEIEKAHPDVFNILLQVLEDGILTDAKGRTADFKNTVIIMTSNVGAKDITDRRFLGFGIETEESGYETMAEAVKAELKRVFKPEFLNRVDETVIFRPLTPEETVKIAELQLKILSSRGRENGIDIVFEPEVAGYLARKGYDRKFGARPLKRVIRREIEDALSEEILRLILPESPCENAEGASGVNTAADPDKDGENGVNYRAGITVALSEDGTGLVFKRTVNGSAAGEI